MSAQPLQAERRPAYHHGDLQRSLLAAAVDLMAEQQSWDFSLREVARRAGVSHNAPYNHFADKRDLLAALAADGFARLTSCTADAAKSAPGEALLAIGLAYVRFGLDNPVLYRLMFGPGFKVLGGQMPEDVACAAKAAKAVLRDAVIRAAEAGIVSVSPQDAGAIDIAVLTAWSVTHGMTMLVLDGLAEEALSVQTIAEAVLRRLLAGLLRRQPE
jgi:AcrR family transcriptional regulator